MPDAPPTIPAGDLAPLLAGTLILGVGLLLLALFLGRRRDRQRLTLHLGLVCLLYGLRLVLFTGVGDLLLGRNLARGGATAITYVINIPFVLFVEELFGWGWKGSIRALRIVWFAFTGVAL